MGGTGNLGGIVAVIGGAYHSCALSGSGNAYCWGYNLVGALGNNSETTSLVPVEVVGLGGSGFLSGLVQLAAGLYHTCALTIAGNVYCWGEGLDGELGNFTASTSLVPVEVVGVGDSGFLSGVANISAGERHACAVTSGGNVFCWGMGVSGQLGANSTSEESTPVEVVGIGGTGFLGGIVSVSGGFEHSCALSAIGNVFCWGDNGYYELGDGSGGGQSNTPVEVQVQGFGRGQSFFSTYVVTPTLVSAVSSGYDSCALTTGGNVYCWGNGANGLLGNGGNSAVYTPVEVQGVTGGTGGNSLGGIVSLGAGSQQTCAINVAGNVYCWGWNGQGEIGINSTTTTYTPTEVLGLGGPNLGGIVNLAGGGQHECAVSGAGNVYCWGGNTNGQLGNNSTTTGSRPWRSRAWAPRAIRAES